MKQNRLILLILAVVLLLFREDFLYRQELRNQNACTLNTGFAFSIDILPVDTLIFASIFIMVTLGIFLLWGHYVGGEGISLSSIVIGENLMFALILSGGLLNLYERAVYGSVCDYINLPFIANLSLNLADIAIVTGATGLIYLNYKETAIKKLDEIKDSLA